MHSSTSEETKAIMNSANKYSFTESDLFNLTGRLLSE